MEQVEMNQEAGTSETSKETPPAEQAATALKPGGIGTGVAFDWGLSAQLVFDGAFFVLGFGPASAVANEPVVVRVGAALGCLVAATLVFIQGEALRRGRRRARIIQIIANSLLMIIGLVNIRDLVPSLQAGRFSELVVEGILLIVNPLIVWLLTRPRTRAWFATTTRAEARARP